PGAGKSTLLLQSCCAVAQSASTLYVSGEESLAQVAERGKRLGLALERIQALASNNVLEIIAQLERLQPRLVVIDSIQVVAHPEIDSLPGSVTQVRECSSLLNQYAKAWGIAVVLVGHITKNDNLAGPMTLNHLVDVTLMLSNSEDARFRFLRADKNRYGSVSESGVFAMTARGMRDVKNPSAMFLNKVGTQGPGGVVTVLWEGTRPLLIEIQALVDKGNPAAPRRLAVGLDNNRLAMLLAVLHKHAGIAIHDQDVFVNVVSGIRISETSADLAVLLSIFSSFCNRTVPAQVIAFGEVGLSGEARPSPNGQERLKEAAKHGFVTALVPSGNASKEPIANLEVVPIAGIADLIAWLTQLPPG
ncbi:MAG: DNA repair protein RadA, partial [Rhodoferax sp.]